MAELKRAKVKLLVDTRAVAASRKPGFSKRQLAATLDENGIAYLHLQKLGTPDDGRQAARAGKLESLWKIYARHLTTPDAIEAMDELISHRQIRPDGVPALLRARPGSACHRSRIAEIVNERTGARGRRSGPCPASERRYSAGCIALASRSTPLTSSATAAVPTTKPIAITAVTESTRSNPPRLCRRQRSC